MWNKVISLLTQLFVKKVSTAVIEDSKEDLKIAVEKVNSKGITIIVDPGHGGNDPGAVYPEENPKYIEAELVLEISGHLVRMLDKAGYKVYLTRADNTSPITRTDRIERIKASKADLLVSIHCNSFHNAAYGIESLYNSSNKESKNLTAAIQNSLMSSFPDHKDRGIKERNNLYVLKTMSPSCLVECEFINTAGEFISNNIKELAESIFKGIESYLNN